MKCRSVEEKLALFVGDDPGADLSAEEARNVASHLASCEKCRALEESYRASQRFLLSGGPLPFGEKDYAEIRKAVRAKIEVTPRRLSFWMAAGAFLERTRPLSLALSAAAVLVLGLLLARWWEQQPPVPVAAHATPPDANTPAPPAAVVVTVLPPAPVQPRVPRPRRPALPTPGNALAVSRIEIQTQNPNVRIIWLPSSPDTSTSETDPGSGI
jgi:Putative zinc-finger